MIWLIILLAQALAAAAQSSAEMTDQAKRGDELFFSATKGTACGACHALGGRGTAVGPDLKRVARIPPRGFVTAIQSTVTQYVVMVKTKTGESFPAMKVKEDGKEAQFYDLSKTPPELRKMAPAEVESTNPNSVWMHPPSKTDYTNEELADVIGFIKWVSYRSAHEIKASELE